MVARKQLPIDQGRLRQAQLGRQMADAAVRARREESERRQAPDRLGAELVQRQLSQSVAVQYGAGLEASELGTGPEGQVVFTGGRERARASIEAMEAEGLSALEVRTISRQHEADLEGISEGLAQGGQMLESEQVRFMMGGHRRQVNVWERGQVEQGALGPSGHLPSAATDLADEAAEMEALRQGYAGASGFIAATPGQIEFAEMAGRFTPQGEPTQHLAAEPEQSVGAAATQGFVSGAMGQMTSVAGPGGLGPKAQARLERRPELAEAVGPRGRVEQIERRTASIAEPEAGGEQEQGPGRH